MAARGNLAKDFITNEILQTFKGSFLNGKEIRIPFNENGENIQIKVTLTAAKDNINEEKPVYDKPTEEEKSKIIEFLKREGC